MPHLQPSALPFPDPSRYLAGDVALAFLIGAGIAGVLVALIGFAALALAFGRTGTRERGILSDVVEGISVGILAFDRRGRLAYANPIAQQSIPSSREILQRGRSFSNIMLALARQGILDLTQEGVTAEAFARDAASDFRLGRFTRTVRMPDARVYRVEQRSPDRHRQILTIADITDLNRREAQLVDLNRQNRLMAIAIDAAPSALYVFNPRLPTNPIIFVNPAFLAMTGSKSGDVVGRSFDFHLADTKDGTELAALRAAIAEGKPLSIDLHATRRDGTTLPCAFAIAPIFGLDGTLELYVATQSDLSERYAQTAKSQQSHRLESLGELASGVAHEFNNLLSIIEGYAMLIRSAMARGEIESDYVAPIIEAARRGAQLSQSLLAFGRRTAPEMCTLDLAALLRRQEPLLRPLLGENHRVALHLSDRSVPVRGSEQMLAQAILNLAINARDAMANGGTIVIALDVRPSSERDGLPGKAVLTVKDTGIGMDPETAQHAFEPFFTTKDGGKGTGLGLPLVARIVEEIGGTVALHSVPTRGTTATITLPLQAVPIVPQAETDAARPHFEGRRAVVVEDEPALLELLRRALQDISFEVHAAASGHEGLAALDSVGVVDVLVTDLVMPEMNGPRLAALAQALRPEIAVVFVTGHDLDAAPVTTLLPRDAIVLKKPFTNEALAASVARALARRGEPQWLLA